MNILVTGGAGYIGSHTCVELLKSGYDVICVDNLCNSNIEALRRVEQISGKDITFYQHDVRDGAALEKIFNRHPIEAVIHFAGLKAVGESVAQPLRYYATNIDSTLVLCDVMARCGCRKLVFSSSATVYGDPERVPIDEDFPVSATNPYGRTKLMIEEILRDLHRADPTWKIALLRYFNPVGAHSSGLIGEDPRGVPNNLLPFIAQVAVGRREYLQVFGDDYPTPDGTGVRDYIHVVDLARGHVSALEVLHQQLQVLTVNLGTGRGYSVLEMVAAFEQISGRKIPYRIVARRPGDIATCYADTSKAERLLNWRAQYDLTRMCADAWNWQKNNPCGYGSTD